MFLRSIDQKTWLLIFAVLSLVLGIIIFWKSRKKHEADFQPSVSSVEDLGHPLTYIFGWLAYKLPAWIWGIFPILLSFYLFYLCF